MEEKPRGSSPRSSKKPHAPTYSEIHFSEDARQRAEEEIAALEPRLKSFIEEMRRDVEELLTSRTISRARSLSQATRQHFNHLEFPMYFTGDLDAPFVLVHLNPKSPDYDGELYEGPFRFPSFEAYFDAHAHFGEYAYGRRSTGRHYSRFDAKQVRFLRAFDVIDFLPEEHPAAKWSNPEKAIDKKLQMEVIPYGSATFTTSGFNRALIQPHIDRLLGVITAAPREYVIFCGSVFEPVLKKYVVKDHSFHLTKKDGTAERQTSRFANLKISFEGGEVRAGLAHSWPRQGIPMSAYGREVKARYHDA